MGTYKDLLEMLGLTHGQFIIFLIVLFLILSFFMLLKKMGFLTTIKFKYMTLPKTKFVYQKYEGNYENLNDRLQ